MRKQLLWVFALSSASWLNGQCPPAAPLPTPIAEPFTSVPLATSGTLSNCWIAGSGAAAAFRWETENSNGANENSGSTGPFFDNTTFGVVGGMYLYLETSSGVAGDSAFFTSPDIDLTGLTTPQLSFAYHMYGATTGTLSAQVWNGSTWNTEASIVGQQQTAGNLPWVTVNIPLTAYTGVIKVRFKGTRGTSFTGDMGLDDISVADPPACQAPSLLGATAVTSNSANLTWNVGDVAATAWNIEYGASGFTQGAGTLVSNHTTNNYSVTGLMPVTTYEFYVNEVCVGGGGAVSTWVGPFPFTTLCAPFTAPYTETFSSVIIGAPLDFGNCWTVPSATGPRWESEDATGANENSTATGPFFDNTTFGVVGGVYMFFETSSGSLGAEGSLISAQYDVTALSAPYVEFYYHMYGATTGTLFIDVQDTNGTWLNLMSIVGQQQTAGSDPWNKTGVSVPLYLAPANGNILQFRVRGQRGASFDGDMSIDDFSVIQAPACPDPVSLMASNVTGTSADISFSSTAASFNIEWGPVGFGQGTGTTASTTASPFTISGLPGNTSYWVYVQADCGVNGTSTWVGPIAFTTTCGILSMPYFQGFETWPPNCFSLAGGTQNFAQFSNAGGSYAWANFWGWTSGTWAQMVTEPIAISTPAQVSIDWSHLYSGTYPLDQLLVQVSVDTPGAPVVTILDLIGPTFTTPGAANTAPTAGPFNQSIAYIPATYVGQNVRVTVRGNSGFGPSVYVDNLTVEAIPSCPDPNALSAFNITANTADLTWLFGGTATNGWNVEWGPVGFGQGTGTLIPSPNDTLSISGLSALTSYDFYVQQDCGSNGTSTWAGPFTFTTGCAAFLAPYFEDFENLPQGPGAFLDYGNCWTMPNITTPRWETEDASGANENSLATGPFFDHTTFGTAGGTYFFFETSGGALGSSNEITTADIDVSALVNPYVEFWYHMYGATMGSIGLDVWNATNGWTNDLITVVGQQQTAGGDPWNKIGATLPSGYTGVVRFRIRGIRGSSFTGDASFDDFSVIEAPACPDINSLATILAQGFQANIGWNGQGGTNFNIEWGPAGFGQGSGTILTSTVDSVLITGLAPTTSYDVYVQNDCGSAGTSNWFGPLTFTTTVTCPAPTAVTASPATTTATMSWQTGGAADFNYVFGPTGTTPTSGTILSGSGASIVLSSLTPSTSYTFWVRDSCGAGDVSTWTGPLNFNTLCVPASIPYLRDFNGANFPPLCWDLTGGTQTVIQNGGQYMEANFWGWTSGNWAPAMTEPITINQNARVKFRWAHLYNTTYPLDQMILMVRLANSSTYDTLINKIGPSFTSPNATSTVPPPAADFVQEIINLDPAIYTGQDVVFLFRFNSGFGPDVFVDDFIVEPLPACPEPTQPSVVNTGSFSADLSWTSGDPAASTWYVEYGPIGFAPGTGTTVTVTSNPATISGLSAATSYGWFVRELCQNGTDTSGYSTPSSFTTLCAPFTAPYLETFTGVAPGVLGTNPATTLSNCWEIGSFGPGTTLRWETEDATGANENNAGTGPFFDNTTPTTAGGMYVFLESSFGVLGNTAAFTSPQIVKSALTTPNLSFAYHMYGATTDSLRVDIWDNVTAAWTNNVWSAFGQQQLAGSDPWITANIGLASYGDTIRVRFVGRKGTSFTGDISLDDIRVDEAPACPSASLLTTVNTTAYTGTVGWTEGSVGASDWIIEYGPAGFALGTGTMVSATTNPFTITGLNAATTYNFYVSEVCPNGLDTSLAVGPGAFNTLCAPISAPYIQTFTGTAPGIIGTAPTPVSLPICWDLGGTSGGERWETEDATGANENSLATGPFFDNTTPTTPGGMYVFLETSTGISTSGPALFTSPEIIVTSLTTPNLSFAYHMYGATMDSLRVDIFGNGMWNNGVWGVFGQQQTAGNDPWLIANIPLASYGDTIRVRFAGKRGTSFTGDISLDDISVDEAPACPSPSSLGANAITATSATLTWSAGAAGATAFVVEYGIGITQPGTGTIVSASTTSLNVTGLSSSSQYCFFVREVCPNGVDTSNAVGPYCFNTLCAPVALPYTTGFTTETAGTFGTQPIRTALNNCWNLAAGTATGLRWETEDASGANENSLATGPFFDNTTPSTIGGMYLFLETSAGATGDTAAATSAQLDLGGGNAQLEFYYHMYGATMGTLVTQINAGAGWVSLDSIVGQQQTAGSDSFYLRTIPLTGYTGIVTLKFLGVRGTSFTSDMSIDDISVITLGNPNCAAPTALTATPSCASATVNWTSGSGTSFLEYGPNGFVPGTGTIMSPATSPATISGLTQTTAYSVYVYDVCNGGVDTSAAATVNFTSASGPVAAFTFSVNQGTVSFNASTSTGGTTYAWDFGDATSGTGVNTTHTYATNGTYTVVLTITDPVCGTTSTSTQTVVITNVASCPQPSGLNTTNVGCDFADLTWNSVSGSSIVQYGPAGFTPGTGTVVAATSPYTLTGLTLGTAYDFWVADICAATSDTSGYSGPFSFTTATGPLPTIVVSSSLQTVSVAGSYEWFFDVSNSLNATGYLWDFGNGTSSTSATPTAVYAQVGQYSVQLTVSNGCGSVDTVFNVMVISLSELEILSSMSLFPNPTSDIVKVVIENNDLADYQFELTDALGRVLEQRESSDQSGRTEEIFDLSAMPKGIYMLRVSTGGESVTRRISRN